MLTDHVLKVAEGTRSSAYFCEESCLSGWPEGRPCHRYVLQRVWDSKGPTLVVIGMNPSAADAQVDDATVRRVSLLARRRWYGSLCMLNAYGFRATDPRALAHAADPVGPENDAIIAKYVADADTILAAWGFISPERDQALRAVLRAAVPDSDRVLCYGLTKKGFPKHPLYQTADPKLIPFPLDTLVSH